MEEPTPPVDEVPDYMTGPTEPCALCTLGLWPHAPTTYKEVAGFVGGPKSDGMALRRDTGRYAHDACVDKAKAGQAPDQAEFDFGAPDG